MDCSCRVCSNAGSSRPALDRRPTRREMIVCRDDPRGETNDMSTAPKSKANQQNGEPSAGRFSAEERAAMKERAAELKAEGRRASAAEKTAAEVAAVLAKIAEMPQPD